MTDEEKSKFYLAVQNFLKSSPLGVSYSGPTNGELNPGMLSSLRNFESVLSLQIGENFNGTIVRGNSISSSGFQKAIQKISPPKKEEKETLKKDNLILEFQKFFSTQHNFLPALYSGPQDGKINSTLISAAQKAEQILSQAVSEPKIQGQIFSVNKKIFLTSPSDLLSAIDLISKNTSNSGNIESSK